ncbi:TatD family hydrolase [Desulfofundulus thermocisternus]|uniref:TatD family hydrolase n=1 Tax=Desulfofundulus thermocisternus TaxID=42471 RepID=UPI00217F098B|nr:TatD family hydrolase [Desulfofundulus thermocisternus]MCS5697076.1 TatD family hydrolase [Desulfofundulus thermocisternus]
MEGIVDSHTHVSLLPYEGLENMALAGVKKIIGCSIFFGARHAETLFDHFHQMLTLSVRNAAQNGIRLFVAVGIHPMGTPVDWPRVIDALPDYLKMSNVIGLGEIGLHEGSQREQDVLREQLKVAKEYGVPVIIHTPPQDRMEITNRTIEIAAAVGMEPGKVIIDHADLDIIDLIENFGAIPGLTIRQKGLTPHLLLNHLERFQRGVLNSDYSNLKPNDPLSVPKAVQYLELNGAPPEIIARIARYNAEELFGI